MIMAGRIRGTDLLLGKDMREYVQKNFLVKLNVHAKKDAEMFNFRALKTTSNVRSPVNVASNARMKMKKTIHVLIWQVFHQNQNVIMI